MESLFLWGQPGGVGYCLGAASAGLGGWGLMAQSFIDLSSVGRVPVYSPPCMASDLPPPSATVCNMIAFLHQTTKVISVRIAGRNSINDLSDGFHCRAL